jgi:EmrB/QacA subfamily drug resistance transporter
MDLRRRNIVISIMVAMFLGAVEVTVVTTAIPTIVKDLQGFEMMSWIFSLYLLTSAISTPIYGKLSDLYGRKNMITIGITIFLIGSFLCGFSRNMYQLIAFRALQGLGAGAIFTISYTIVGDIFSLSERAKVQGWLGTVWGIASLAGPLLGGFLIDTLSWHWIFFINIPFGIISIILLRRNLSENFEKKKHRIDLAGTFLLAASIGTLLYAALSGGSTSNWYSPSVIGYLSLSLTALVAFYFVEKRASEPIIPFEIFTKTNILVNIISFLSSAVLIGANVYLPIYIQNVLGHSATVSGLSLAPMTLGWILASVILAKALQKHGERLVISLSTFVLLLSCLLLYTLKIDSPLILVIAFSFVMGFGFGGGFTTLTIVVQHSVDYTKRGAATASNSLLRTLGQTIGVSILGGIFNTKIIKYFNNLGISGVDPDNLYSAANTSMGITLEHIRASINSGVHVVITVFILLTLICLIVSSKLSNDLKE